MRRQILRFPVGQQFKKILEDDHEWIVLTDLHLRPLVMNRCDTGGITASQRIKAYYELSQKTKVNGPMRIYDLHTHPGEDKVDILAPSETDMGNFVYERATQRFRKDYGVTVAGSGVITKKGILLVKIAEKTSKQAEKDRNLQVGYSRRIHREVRKDNLKLTEKDDTEEFKLLVNSHKKALKSLVSETEGMSSKTIRRRHRFNVGRRR